MSKKVMEIGVRENGVHSLAKSLEAFKTFHDNPDDIYALKDAIICSHHAFETLFKHVLFNLNPVLLLKDDVKTKDIVAGYEKLSKGEVANAVEELDTTNLETTIRRLQQLGILGGLTPKELGIFLDSAKELTKYRNRLQHFSVRAEQDEVSRILGNVIPRGIDVINKIAYPTHFMMLETTIVRVEPLIQELKKFYDKAPEIVELLRHDYDKLIEETIKFFEKKTFDNQTLKLKLTDYGKVGAPPYFPEFVSEGFLNLRFDHEYMLEQLRCFTFSTEVDTSSYKAEINISEPENIGAQVGDFTTVEGKLEFNSSMIIHKAERSLFLPDASDKIQVLKALQVAIGISFEYSAAALWNLHHFDVEKITKGQGQLLVKLSAIPKGYGSKEAEIIGKYEIQLNENSAPFRLHCFVNPDKSLKKDANYLLEWNVNTEGKVEFI